MAVSGNEEKKQLVVAILVPNSQTGMYPTKIYDEYYEQVGQQLMPTPHERQNFLNNLVAIGDILESNGLYYANTKNSQHVIKLVKDETQKNRKNFNGSFQGRNNFHNQPLPRSISGRRKSIGYEQPYIDVYRPSPPAPARIQRRRMTMGANQQFRPDTPPRSRSRSKSPKKNDTFGRSHYNNEKRSYSPDLRSKRQRDHAPGSPAAKRSRWSRSRSRSPRRDPRRRAVSRSRSPIERKRHNPCYEQNKPPVRPMQENKPPVPTVQENTPPVRPVQTVTPQGPSQRTAINERLNSVTAVAGPSCNVRSFKFNLIGDGLLYHVVHGLDDSIALNPYLISRELLLKTAIESVSGIISPRVNKKKCIILSIGTGDLRKGTSLIDMRKLFLTLYRLCQNNGLKPLVATISCMETQELIEKSKVFNEFLKQNFDNVIDLFKAVNGTNGGLAHTLASLRKGPKPGQNRATLSIGMHSRLVLRVEV